MAVADAPTPTQQANEPDKELKELIACYIQNRNDLANLPEEQQTIVNRSVLDGIIKLLKIQRLLGKVILEAALPELLPDLHRDANLNGLILRKVKTDFELLKLNKKQLEIFTRNINPHDGQKTEASKTMTPAAKMLLAKTALSKRMTKLKP